MDKSHYAVKFDKDSFHPESVSKLKHNWQKHPLFQKESIKHLALKFQQSNPDQVRYAEMLSEQDDFITNQEDPFGRDLEQIFDHIHLKDNWLAIYNIEKDPRYKKLMWDVIESCQPDLERLDPKKFGVAGFIFLSSSPAKTPFHIDRLQNIFLQCNGIKHLSVWDPNDRDAVSEEGIEGWVVHKTLEKVRFKDGLCDSAVFNRNIGEGEGVFIPSTAPHMTHTPEQNDKNEDLSNDAQSYSLSVSINYFSKSTRHNANVYMANSQLRKFGWNPLPPNRNKLIDTLKIIYSQVSIIYRRLFKGIYRPDGF